MFTIDRSLKDKKAELLAYFRNRAAEAVEEIYRTFGIQEFKERATAINKSVTTTRNEMVKVLYQKATGENWSKEDVLRSVLMITYVSYVVMIEYRNEVWPYDYMSFSRRIGELWEPFCKLCFETPLSNAMLFVPPLFSEVKQKLTEEIISYIDQLAIQQQQKDELKKYYR